MNILIKLPIHKIRTLFNHSYCKTGHSLQGITIAEPTTIFDWEMPYVSLKWIWVAVTRTMNMNDVLIYNGKSQEFNETVMNKFFELKIKDYQIQDTKAKRTLDSKNYVNPEWFKQFLASPCPKCNNTYNMHHDKYRFYADITANRLDNSLCHSLDNIEPCCSKCNSDLSDKGDKDKQPLESSKTNQD
jgi:hypothetical protein